jgi:hypothetical protein
MALSFAVIMNGIELNVNSCIFNNIDVHLARPFSASIRRVHLAYLERLKRITS